MPVNSRQINAHAALRWLPRWFVARQASNLTAAVAIRFSCPKRPTGARFTLDHPESRHWLAFCVAGVATCRQHSEIFGQELFDASLMVLRNRGKQFDFVHGIGSRQ
jgi:hypothetical protein